jgi:pimeloyl-ACP methyl ester carboxylesterase
MNLHEMERYRNAVVTRSGEISYVDAGDGPLALFVHGVGTNAYLWRNVIGLLHSERRCVAIDLPLHGHTPVRPNQDLSLTALAQLVEDFCEALDLRDIDLVANDTGGAIAQIFAARHPGRLATFTLTNCETHDNVPPPAFKPTVWLARAGLLAPLMRGLGSNPGRARRFVFGSGYEHPERLSDDVVRAYLEPLLGTRRAAREFQRWIASMHSSDLLAVEPDLRRLTVPALVVWGTGDMFFDRKWAYWLRDTIPGVTEVVEIEGARLFLPDERADELVFHLRRRWAAHGHAPAGDYGRDVRHAAQGVALARGGHDDGRRDKNGAQ